MGRRESARIKVKGNTRIRMIKGRIRIISRLRITGD